MEESSAGNPGQLEQSFIFKAIFSSPLRILVGLQVLLGLISVLGLVLLYFYFIKPESESDTVLGPYHILLYLFISVTIIVNAPSFFAFCTYIVAPILYEHYGFSADSLEDFTVAPPFMTRKIHNICPLTTYNSLLLYSAAVSGCFGGLITLGLGLFLFGDKLAGLISAMALWPGSWVILVLQIISFYHQSLLVKKILNLISTIIFWFLMVLFFLMNLLFICLLLLSLSV